jgi:hypothetical protein
VDGTHTADPFPVTLVRPIFCDDDDVSKTLSSDSTVAEGSVQFSSPSIRVKMTNADGTSSLSVPLSSSLTEGDSASVGQEQQQMQQQQQQFASMEPPLKPVRLEGVGWVGRTEKGDLWIHCEDGVQMTLSSGGEELYYADVCIGEPRIYKVNATLPPHVKKRLPFVSKAMSSLRKNKIRYA